MIPESPPEALAFFFIPLQQPVGCSSRFLQLVSRDFLSVLRGFLLSVSEVSSTCIRLVIVKVFGASATNLRDLLPGQDISDFRVVRDRFSKLHAEASE